MAPYLQDWGHPTQMAGLGVGYRPRMMLSRQRQNGSHPEIRE
jgi:hypothetical protein